MTTLAIRELDDEAASRHRDGLARILADCVEGGASVSFMWPFGPETAQSFWRRVIEQVGQSKARLFVAFAEAEPVGTVLLDLDLPENQPHRAEIRKLLVRPAWRGAGIAAGLMTAAEKAAVQSGRTLLTLDTVTDSAGDRLYRRLGWTCIGAIPGFALWPDGRPCDASIFYKEIRPPAP